MRGPRTCGHWGFAISRKIAEFTDKSSKLDNVRFQNVRQTNGLITDIRPFVFHPPVIQLTRRVNLFFSMRMFQKLAIFIAKVDHLAMCRSASLRISQHPSPLYGKEETYNN